MRSREKNSIHTIRLSQDEIAKWHRKTRIIKILMDEDHKKAKREAIAMRTL